MNVLDNIFKKSRLDVTSLLPIIRYDDNNNCFEMKNGKYMDLIGITTKDLEALSYDEMEWDILSFARFYKTFGSDVKIIGMNFPTNTKPQQQYVIHKLKTTKNEIYKHFLSEKLSELEWIEKNRTDREYYLMFFSDSPLKHKDNINILQKSLGANGLVFFMNKEKKIQILFKLNNKNSCIFI